MIYLDTPLGTGFRFYDPHLRWLAPGGLTPNQLADTLYNQWKKHADIKTRFRVTVSRESALATVCDYLKQVFGYTVQGYQPVLKVAPMKVAAPDPPRVKRSKCCGQK